MRKRNIILISILIVLTLGAILYFAIVWNKIPTNWNSTTSTRSLTLNPTYFVWTQVPTLPASISDPTITAIYKHNSCELPCWQGITPGETTWRQAWNILGPIAKNQFPDQMILEIGNDPQYYYFTVDLSTLENADSFGRVDFTIRKADLIVEHIRLNAGDEEDLRIHEILQKYGKPKGIYYQDYSRPSGYNIWLYLYYPDQGFIASYFTTFETNDWSILQHNICFEQNIILSLWPSDANFAFPSATADAPEIDDTSIQYVVPIDEVSNLTRDQFYNMNVNNNGAVCFSANLQYYVNKG